VNASQFFGKYRGIVSSIEDPLFLGRITAKVPEVYGDEESGWAMPAMPFGGSGMGFFALPASGANVWIEFEHGDPDYPIWTGCFWTEPTDVPQIVQLPVPYQKALLQTSGGNQIVLDDTPVTGGITIQSSTGMQVTLDAQGVTITSGAAKIEVSLTGIVTINDDGLAVI
jgi:uncharacterized protein involved in type VI secretion and phage assembly